ncbi:MAG: hypothetical protein AAFZ65_13340 [Planctomycetota bacterium]
MASSGKRTEIEALTRRVRAIERGGARVEPRPLVTGWALDGVLADGAGGGGLARGAVHEWLGLDDAAGAARMRGGLAAWTPPLSLLVELCRRALEEHTARGQEGWVVWIGSRVWPYPQALTTVRGVRSMACERDGRRGGALEGERFELWLDQADGERGCADGERSRRLLERSLFVDPVDLAARVWAADGALRCPSVAAVVLEGKGLRMPAGRRLQLAAEAGGGLAFVARAADEAGEVSAATTRWRVRRAAPGGDGRADGIAGDGTAGEGARPRWEVELLRAKVGLLGGANGASTAEAG